MKDSLGLNNNETVLKFHDLVTREMCQRSLNNRPQIEVSEIYMKNEHGLDWSCFPRPKPLAINDSTHDLPNFNKYTCKDALSHFPVDQRNSIIHFAILSDDYNVIDWSKKGRIAASFDRDLVLWGPPSARNSHKATEVYKLGRIKSLAFSTSGDELALGIYAGPSKNLLQILKVGKTLYRTKHFKFPLKPKDEIRTIAWDPSGENILWYVMTQFHFHFFSNFRNFPFLNASGFKCGDVHFLKYPELTVWKIYNNGDCITDIKYSANRTFIAIVDASGTLTVFRRESFQKVRLRTVHFFAWHPWQETDLIIACKFPLEITLFDVSTKTKRATYRRMDRSYSLHAIALNPVTAELVASFARIGEEHSEILVMASMNRIVDNISGHSGAVSFIMWNPNGTHIGECGNSLSTIVNVINEN